MKKSELKNGAVVELRNGGKYLKVDDTLILLKMDGGWNTLTEYNEDLTHQDVKEADIIKVNNDVGGGCRAGALISYQKGWTWIRGEAILDKEEKEYLEAVIKPFKDKVDCIVKYGANSGEYIKIWLGISGFCLPYFTEGSMYNGMQVNKRYTLKELGLFEEKK